MTDNAQRNPMTLQPVVYDMPGTDRVIVRRDVAFQGAGGSALVLDLYSPPDATPDVRAAAVIIVAGYRDAGFLERLGCRFKEMQSSVSWGRLIAASGMAAITYTNADPAADLHAVLDHLRQNAASLGIDEHRLGLWSSSGNSPVALSALMREGRASPKCAVICYGFTLDLDGAIGVADAARQFGFANPGAGKSIDDVPKETPLFLARAGQDQFPGVNESLDRFLAAAVARNLPVTFVNHPSGPHAFDLFQDSEASRRIVRQVLAFLRDNLLSAAASPAVHA
jgi:dienelactone hydrolase